MYMWLALSVGAPVPLSSATHWQKAQRKREGALVGCCWRQRCQSQRSLAPLWIIPEGPRLRNYSDGPFYAPSVQNNVCGFSRWEGPTPLIIPQSCDCEPTKIQSKIKDLSRKQIKTKEINTNKILTSGKHQGPSQSLVISHSDSSHTIHTHSNNSRKITCSYADQSFLQQGT